MSTIFIVSTLTGGDALHQVDDVAGVGRAGFSASAPHRVFRELITEQAEPGEDLIYGEATKLVVE